jgi:hypothetical protein
MRTRKMSDKALLESLVSKYGKNKIVRAINEMDIYMDREYIDRLVRIVIDENMAIIDEPEYSANFHENPEEVVQEFYYLVTYELDNQGIDSTTVPASMIRGCIKNYLYEIL